MSDTTSIEWATATQRRRPGRVASGFDQRAHPTSSITDWRRVAARMRAELDRAASASVSFHTADGKREWNPVKLAGRPKELAELVVKATLARGRWQVVIPELAKFGEQVGIRDTHIRGVFHVLECARIVELERGERGWTLTVFPHSPEWLGVTWRYEEKSLLDYLAALDRAPGQVQAELFDAGEVETTAAPAFTRARAESASAQASSSRNGNQFPKREPEAVPETGTGSRAVNSKTVLLSSQLSQSSQLSEEAVKPGKPLNSEPRRGVPLTSEQRGLMERLKLALGAEQMQQWGGDWLANYVRPMPRALAVALDELRLKEQQGEPVNRPVHWLKSTARHVHEAQRVHGEARA